MWQQALLFLIPLLLSTTARSQADYRVIGAAQLIEQSFESDFYVRQVVDDRAFRANLGIVNRGADRNLKRPLILEAHFWEHLTARAQRWARPTDGADAVTVYVKELFFWEHLYQDDEGQGFIRLKVSFETTDGKQQDIALQLSGPHLTVAHGHSPRLEDAFFQCLQRYQQARELGSAYVYAANVGGSRAIPANAGAKNFLDLYNGNLASFTGRLKPISNKNLNRFSLKSRKDQEKSDLYAIKLGQEWFLRAYTYPGGGNYFTRVLESGRYWFLIDRMYAEPDSDLFGRGVFAGSVAGIVLDTYTGVPHIVNDEFMGDLLEGYPDLKGKYIFQDILENPVQLGRIQAVIAEINSRYEERG